MSRENTQMTADSSLRYGGVTGSERVATMAPPLVDRGDEPTSSEMGVPIEMPSPWGFPANTGKPIEIESLNFGYIVRVGCHRFAIQDANTLVLALSEYLGDPAGTEEKWFKGEFMLKRK